jgi:hypothetical protein
MVTRLKLLEFSSHARSKAHKNDKHALFDKQQTERTIVQFSYQEREKKERMQPIDHQQQSNHYLSTHATPCARGHDCASS